MAMQPKLANFQEFKEEQKSRGAVASNENIEELEELKDRWLEIVDAVKTTAIPVLSWLLETIFDFGHSVKQLVELLGTTLGAFWGVHSHRPATPSAFTIRACSLLT
jgi:hypothetical protein